MRTAILALVVLTAFASPAAAKRAPAPPALPADLAVFGPAGVQLGTTLLYGMPVDAAAYDAAQGLIWLVSQRELLVIDLRDAHPTAVVIAKGLPDGIAAFGVTGWSKAERGTGYIAVYPSFALGAKTVTVTAGTGASLGIDGDSDKKVKKAIKKIKIAGAAWIAAQRGRKANAAPAKRDAPPKVTLPPDRGSCDDPDRCGTAAWLGDSPYQTVVVQTDCGGPACMTTCVLYDPRSKQYAPAASDGTWGALAEDASTMDCDDVELEPGAGHYFGANIVCTLGAGKMTCVGASPWVPFAWVRS